MRFSAMKLACLIAVLLGAQLMLADDCTNSLLNPNGRCVLEDMNSLMVINTNPTLFGGNPRPGIIQWTVDGVDQLFQQWFWYRTAANDREWSLSTLPLIYARTEDMNGNFGDDVFAARWAYGALQVDLQYTLAGGSTHSFLSDLSELIRVSNVSQDQTLDMAFFQYVDFDLDGTPGGDFVHFRSANSVGQWGNGGMVSETVVLPSSSHHEAEWYPYTHNALEDNNPTTLNDISTAGPGDVTWAFEWDRLLGPGQSLIISKDKALSPVPEPASVLLLGGGLLAFFTRLRRAAR